MQVASRRVAHIHLGENGGAERFFVRLAGGLAARGIEQIAFIRAGRAWRDELAQHCTVHEVKFSRAIHKRGLIRYMIGRKIARFGATAALAWMSPAARWLPAPRADLRTFIRLGDFPDGFATYGNVERLIGNTPEIIRRSIAQGWPANRARMISNFVAQDQSVPVDRASLLAPPDAMVVVALGRFVPRKRFDLLIDAVSRVPGVHLWLVGDGPGLDNAYDQVAALRLGERVRLLGWQENAMRYIKAADVLCCPSQEEPLGNVVLEGWAAGLPVVAAASEGPVWLIKDGETGLLTPLGEAAPLAAAIERLRDNPDLRAKLGEGGARELQARFSEDAICRTYIEHLLG